jgi:hypothetical protein
MKLQYNKAMNSTVYPLFACVNFRTSNFVTHTPIAYTASYCGVKHHMRMSHEEYIKKQRKRAAEVAIGMLMVLFII